MLASSRKQSVSAGQWGRVYPTIARQIIVAIHRPGITAKANRATAMQRRSSAGVGEVGRVRFMRIGSRSGQWCCFRCRAMRGPLHADTSCSRILRKQSLETWWLVMSRLGRLCPLCIYSNRKALRGRWPLRIPPAAALARQNERVQAFGLGWNINADQRQGV